MPALLTTRSSGAAAARAATASTPASLAMGDQRFDLGLVRGAEALRERLQPIAPARDDDEVVAGRGELLGEGVLRCPRRRR